MTFEIMSLVVLVIAVSCALLVGLLAIVSGARLNSQLSRPQGDKDE